MSKRAQSSSVADVIVEGHVVAGKYPLERQLARGGQGAVWVGRHVKLQEPVAVKFMLDALDADPEARTRFEREATAVAQLQRRTHHVVQIHDYGVDENTDIPYIVMELLEGESLRARLKRIRRLDVVETAHVLIQLCKALRPAHKRDIIHRDIKPGNVFLAQTEEGEVVKLLDFGLAKGAALDVDGDSTTTGTLVGSPHYMSPEQAQADRDLDSRCDLWALAVVAYRALTGELPFPGRNLGDVIVKVCRDPAPPPTGLVDGLPPTIDGFFERALAKNPDERFQTAHAFVQGFVEAAQVDGDRDSTRPSLPTFDSGSSVPHVGVREVDVELESATTPMARGAGAAMPEMSAGTLTHAGSLAVDRDGPRTTGRRVAWAIGFVAIGAGLGGSVLWPDQPALLREPAAVRSTSGPPFTAAERHADTSPSAVATASASVVVPRSPPSRRRQPPRAAPEPRHVPDPRPQNVNCPPGGFHPVHGFPCPR